MDCPKCDEEMEQGFVLNRVHEVTAPHWYSGMFKRTFWGGVDLKNRKRFYVQTWRCTECGYLEAYAL
jgi:hypothetical protein